MQPLSARTRFRFFLLMLAAFIVVVPVAVLYATGYRLADLSLAETGGVYVTVPLSDVTVTLNGEEVGASGLFDRTLYLSDLSPDTYVVQAAREGYYPWTKTVTVQPWVVTDVHALMVPTSLPLREVEVGTDDAATTSVALSVAAFAELRAAFATTTSATSTALDTQAGMGLYIEQGDVVVRWQRSVESVPSAFCARPGSCTQEFRVERERDTVLDARFFSGGVVYRTASGIYFADIDVRLPQLVLPLYTRAKADFRVIDDALYIKDETSYYRIDAF